MSRMRFYSEASARLRPWDGGTPVIQPVSGTGGIVIPPPGGAGMLVGASTVNGDPGGWNTLQAAAGPWTVARSFNAGTMQSTFAADVSAADVGRCASSYSAKPDLAAMAAGSLDALVTGFVTSIPSSHVAFLTIWHEPDVKTRKGTLSGGPAAFRAGFARFCQLVKAVGKPHVYTQLILSNYSLITPGLTVGLADDFWPGAGLVDLVGFDTYMVSNTSLGGAHQLGPCVTWARGKNIPCAIPELGLDAAVTSHTAATAWMSDVTAYAAANATGASGSHTSFAYSTFFNAGTPKYPSDNSDYIANSKAISELYYTPYAAFVL